MSSVFSVHYTYIAEVNKMHSSTVSAHYLTTFRKLTVKLL
jgi:hypothetical protein